MGAPDVTAGAHDLARAHHRQADDGGDFTFTLHVTDQGGQQATRQFSITSSP